MHCIVFCKEVANILRLRRAFDNDAKDPVARDRKQTYPEGTGFCEINRERTNFNKCADRFVCVTLVDINSLSYEFLA